MSQASTTSVAARLVARAVWSPPSGPQPGTRSRRITRVANPAARAARRRCPTSVREPKRRRDLSRPIRALRPPARIQTSQEAGGGDGSLRSLAPRPGSAEVRRPAGAAPRAAWSGRRLTGSPPGGSAGGGRLRFNGPILDQGLRRAKPIRPAAGREEGRRGSVKDAIRVPGRATAASRCIPGFRGVGGPQRLAAVRGTPKAQPRGQRCCPPRASVTPPTTGGCPGPLQGGAEKTFIPLPLGLLVIQN
jgi:hypothetical protein